MTCLELPIGNARVSTTTLSRILSSARKPQTLSQAGYEQESKGNDDERCRQTSKPRSSWRRRQHRTLNAYKNLLAVCKYRASHPPGPIYPAVTVTVSCATVVVIPASVVVTVTVTPLGLIGTIVMPGMPEVWLDSPFAVVEEWP